MLSISKLYVLSAAVIHTCFAQIPATAPLVIPPSGQWDGIDGPWSTFNLGVGDPIQSFRCIPGISQPVAMLPIESPECNNATGGSCRDRATFRSENSKSWSNAGLYDVPLDYFDNFKNGTAATWGVDNIFFGNNAIRDIGSAQQYVLLMKSLDLFVGIFGLSVGAISPSGAIRPTLLSAIADANTIPSTSFSYTAGSVKKNTTGSLILGGYDTSRFNSSTTLSVPMPSRQNNTLVVNLEAIHLHGQTEMTWPTVADPQPIELRIDSVLPQIWLPLEACKVFEEAFNLTWSDSAEAYILTEAAHERLLLENPSATFTISSHTAGSARNFTLPYSAFDLRMEYPYLASPMPYFPLKRANSSVQYMLGRAFLQEVYVIVDYERANFSLSQAYSTGGSGYIFPIYNTTYSPSSTSLSSKNETGSLADDTSAQDISTGAYVGIGVGAGLIVLIIGSLLLAWKKGWGCFVKKRLTPDPIGKAELHGEHKAWIEAMEKERAELPGKMISEVMERELAELETVETSHEAGGPRSPTVSGLDALHELYGEQIRRSRSSSRSHRSQ